MYLVMIGIRMSDLYTKDTTEKNSSFPRLLISYQNAESRGYKKSKV